MHSHVYLILIFCFVQIIPTSYSLYFHISEAERKCFIEEIPDDTLVIGKYKVELFDEKIQAYLASTPGIGMHVEIKDPDEKIILSKVYTSEGRFTFTSHIPGEHVICLYSNSTAWFGGQKLVKFFMLIYFRISISFYSVFILILKLVNMQLIIKMLMLMKNLLNFNYVLDNYWIKWNRCMLN
jgi:hypothetical protein